jgi:hypothetical protein
VAALLLYAPAVLSPALVLDDFQLLSQSWTWPIAWGNVWLPTNEHAMPLGRLTIWVLDTLTGPVTALPYVAALQGPLAVVLGMALVYLFVRRELGHPFYGLAAMTLFGVTSIYQQAVFWFSSSFSVLTLDTLLLGLLAAQAWRQTGRLLPLLLCAVCCGLALGWFASGVLAGPLCCLYLLPQEDRPAAPWLRRGLALVPLLGTAGFLAISLPRTAEHILHLEHYQGQTAVEAFRPLNGVIYTGRALIDGLLLGQVGVTGVPCPVWLVVPLLCLLTAAAGWWLWVTPRRRLLLLGLGMILLSYLLVYSARGTWDYDRNRLYHLAWSRYHLLPQLGLTLFFVGGLPRWQGLLRTGPDDGLARRHVWAVVVLIGGLFVVQLPRAVFGPYAFRGDNTRQMAVLRKIDAVDAACREHHVGREAAIEALTYPEGLGEGKPATPLEIPLNATPVNGWEFLRGSPDPRPVLPEEIRRLLEGVE